MLDQIDRRILTELQRDATIPIAQLADRVGLSQTPCWKRLKKLESEGVILAREARVDPVRLGLGLTVWVEVEALDHTEGWRENFLSVVVKLPAVMEVYRLGGSADYLMRIVVPDMGAYDAVYRQLTGAVGFRAVTSKFVMEQVHRKAVLPPVLRVV